MATLTGILSQPFRPMLDVRQTGATPLWLGHEQVATTSIYLHADMSQKERAIARVTPPGTKPGCYRAPDSVLAFLEVL